MLDEIRNFVSGISYLELCSIEAFYAETSEYVSTTYADVYEGDAYYQDWLGVLTFVEEVIADYESTVELYYKT